MAWKRSSELLNLGGSVTESAANTYTQARISLPLTTLDREIFIVTDCWIQSGEPSAILGTNTALTVQITKSSQTGLVGINNPTCVSRSERRHWSPAGAVAISAIQTDFPQPNLSGGTTVDYLAVIATPDFFVACQGSNNTAASGANVRLQGFRARADADTYAALVTEELNQ